MIVTSVEGINLQQYGAANLRQIVSNWRIRSEHQNSGNQVRAIMESESSTNLI